MIVMTRNADISQEEFVHWWTGQHGRLAAALPKIRRIILNATLDGEIGGIAELCFDSQEDAAATLGSEAGQVALADAQTMASHFELLHVAEHELPLSGA